MFDLRGKLPVSEMFLSIQGEGPRAGTPSLFIRTAFCNLTCSWCDTKYTWDWSRYRMDEQIQPMTETAVAERALSMLANNKVRNLVLTGGEPLLHQAKLASVLKALKTKVDLTVEVETNGTIPPQPWFDEHVSNYVCSPKLSNSGIPRQLRIKPAVLKSFVENQKAVFKFVVMNDCDVKEFFEELVKPYGIRADRVWVMPEGTDAETVVERSKRLVEECKRYGFNFSTRLHILLWGNVRAT